MPKEEDFHPLPLRLSWGQLPVGTYFLALIPNVTAYFWVFLPLENMILTVPSYYELFWLSVLRLFISRMEDPGQRGMQFTTITSCSLKTMVFSKDNSCKPIKKISYYSQHLCLIQNFHILQALAVLLFILFLVIRQTKSNISYIQTPFVKKLFSVP